MTKTAKKVKTQMELEESSLRSRFSISRQQKISVGIFLVLLSIALGVSFISYFVN